MASSRYSINTFLETEQTEKMSRKFSNSQTITKPFIYSHYILVKHHFCGHSAYCCKHRQAINWSNVLAVLKNLFRQDERCLLLCVRSRWVWFHAYAQRNMQRILQSQLSIFLEFQEQQQQKNLPSHSPHWSLDTKYVFKGTLHVLKCSSTDLQILQYYKV